MTEKLKVEPLVLLLEALDDALTYIEYRANSTPPPYNEHELQLVQQIKAAIAAAEGEWRNEINVQSTKFESSGVLSVGDEIVLPKRGE